ncbi:MAG: DUF3179 domain-containing (seleno)protein [Planctomycetota bacterium]
MNTKMLRVLLLFFVVVAAVVVWLLRWESIHESLVADDSAGIGGHESGVRQSDMPDLLRLFDTSNPVIDLSEVIAGGPPKDGIPALTDPHRVAIEELGLGHDARLVEVSVGKETVAYPIAILNYHEIVNDMVGGIPVAVTYCPLCDSVSVLDRRLTDDQDRVRSIELGVSGLLMNSNVLMYDRENDALWSQVKAMAVTGPDAGHSLAHLPFVMTTASEFALKHPGAPAISTDTGHARNYNRAPYEQYFSNPNYVFHEFEYGDELPPKLLGVGLVKDDEAVFVPAVSASEAAVSLNVSDVTVTLSFSDHGLSIAEVPAGLVVVQTYWHSWSAYHSETVIFDPGVDQP